MAKSISADKRENEKKRLARRAEKQKKKEEHKEVIALFKKSYSIRNIYSIRVLALVWF